MVAVQRYRGGLAGFVGESPIHRGPILVAVERFAAGLPAGSRVLDAGAGRAPYREVLEHVATPETAASELFRVLRPGGRLLVTVPFVAELHEEPHDHYRYTRLGIRGLLERAGFLVESVAPLSGYFSTMAHLTRVGGLAMRPTGSRPPAGTRLAALVLQGASLLMARPARALDRLDARRGLPLGWVALGSVPRG